MLFETTRPGLRLSQYIWYKLCRERGLKWASHWLRSRLRNEVVDCDGKKFDILPGDNHTESKIWLTGTCSDRECVDWILSHTKDKKTLFLDIGANCGFFSVFLGDMLAQGSRTIAFEPNPEMIARLERNLQLNQLDKTVQIEKVALGAEAGTATLHLDSHNLGQTSLHAAKNPGGEYLVDVKTLDQFLCDADEFEYIAIKVDVEGFEDQVFAPLVKGDKNVRLPDLIMMEILHEQKWETDVVRKLKSIGYQEWKRTRSDVWLVLDGKADM